VEGSGHAGPKQRHVVPGEESAEKSGCPVVAAGVIGEDVASNGLAATPDAACAARRALALLEDGDVAGARALLEEIIRSS